MLKKLVLVALLGVSLGACDHMSNREQRTVSGGAIGAGGGAVLGAIAGFNPLVGAAVGAAGGAAIGAVTGHDGPDRRR